MKHIFWGLVIISIVLIAVLVSGERDKKVMQVEAEYEKCVLAEYGVGPANWYEANGEYPPCPVQ